jgi:hypothetical protein
VLLNVIYFRIGVIIVLVMTVANAIVWIVKQILDVSNDARVWGRFFLTFTSVFMVTFFFFATLAKPMFKVHISHQRKGNYSLKWMS